MNEINSLINKYQQQTGMVSIDLGCGPNKKTGMIGIDVLPLPGVDIVANLEKGLPDIPENSVDEYNTTHFLEHVVNFELLMEEIYRTLKPGGKVKIAVPHFSNPYFYSDYTHKRFFGLYTFDYFTEGDSGFRRKVPVYNSSIRFKITYRRLIFRSPYFFFNNLIKKHLWTRLFNASKYMQALYEDSFSNLIPCYEVIFELQAVK